MNDPTANQACIAPATVQIAQVVIAAGIAGRTVSLYYDGYPADILCAHWRQIVKDFSTGQILHVHTQADVRKLEKDPSGFRLVILHKRRFAGSVGWTLQMSSSQTGQSRPAIFSCCVPDDRDSEPGAALVLHADHREVATVTRAIENSQQAGVDWSVMGEQLTTTSSIPNADYFQQLLTNDRLALESFREAEIVRSLAGGASLLVRAESGYPEQDLQEAALTAYDRVRRLLQSRIVCAAARPRDELAAAMVGRANVFLSVVFDEDQSERNPFAGEFRNYPAPSSKRHPSRELITRREVANLGNPHSMTLRELVKFLQQSANGFERFIQLGLVGKPPQRNQWNQQPIDALIERLQTWSPKQVRTHFDRLRREGLLTAERIPANGPLVYLLPENLSTMSSPFANLPPASEILAELSQSK